MVKMREFLANLRKTAAGLQEHAGLKMKRLIISSIVKDSKPSQELSDFFI